MSENTTQLGILREKLKNELKLTDEQIDVLFEKIDERVIWKALERTFNGKIELFKMNLKIFTKLLKK